MARVTTWGLLAGWLLVAGCTRPNERYCKKDEDCPDGRCNLIEHRCEAWDAQVARADAGDAHVVREDAGDAQAAREDAGDAQVVSQDAGDAGEPDAADAEPPPECVTSGDCTDQARPICEDGTCRGCIDSSECAAGHPGLETCDPATGRCVAPGCGNGVIEPGEDCDGTNLGGATCQTAVGLQEGELRCTADCRLDTRDCHTCGNGQIEGPEFCDGDAVNDTCQTLGYYAGTLRCNQDCSAYDESGCTNCGNGVCDLTRGESVSNCPADCGWTDLCAGRDFTCAIKTDGTLWCWGLNDWGQLGIGSTGVPSRTPGRNLLSDAVQVACGDRFACAVDAQGRLWCWGHNLSYRVGQDAEGSVFASPVRAAQSVPHVDRVWAGADFGCLLSGQQLLCWGANDQGQLADFTTNSRPDPACAEEYVSASCLVAELAPGPSRGQHFCSPGRNQSRDPNLVSLYCWGNNDSGQVGNVGSGALQWASDLYVSFEPAAVAEGGAFTCALDTDGNLRCWGDNTHGQLGLGDTDDRSGPTWVSAAGQVDALALGRDFTCVLAGGAVSCWGDNARGQLGLGDQNERHAPSGSVAGLGQVVQVAAGWEHVCALTADGRISCWGKGTVGCLGNGGSSDSAVPVQVADPYGP